MLKKVKAVTVGVLFVFTLYITALIGAIFLIGPAMPLLFINGRLFRKCADYVAYAWFILPAALLELFYGIKIIINGDMVPKNESALIIMNHRCRLDWMFYLMVMVRNGRLDRKKIILKDDLRLLPGPGWAMQSCMFVFLKRRWKQDRDYLNAILNYFIDNKYPVQLLLFPEGTSFCEAMKAKSDSYARKNNLPIYEYVLHPHARGFSFIVDKMRNGTLKAVHDVTIGYQNGFCYGEQDIMRGQLPGEVHVNVKRYKIDFLPRDSDPVENWCINRWSEKEERLMKFYKEGKFTENKILFDSESEMLAKREMQAAVVFWMAFLVFVIYGLYHYFMMRWFALAVSAFYLGSLCLFGGIDRLQIKLHEQSQNTI